MDFEYHGIPAHEPGRFPSFEVVAYHASCTDGIAAAAVVGAYFEQTGAMPEFIPVDYNQPLPELIAKGGQRLLFVDFCPEREQLEQIKASWEDFFVIDHHKSREWTREYPWWQHVFYSKERSGAVLTQIWFSRSNTPIIPDLLCYVQDRDLWRWELPNSREISAALNEEPKTVERFMALIDTPNLDALAVDGELLLRARTRHAKSLAKKAFWVGSDYGDGFMAVNATEHISEVCEEILAANTDCLVACAWFALGAHHVQLSFRSRAHDPHHINALGMAEYFGGGGHAHSAGSKMSLPTWSRYLECVGYPLQTEGVANG